jgi:Mrp family chromosome partitioning ATPase
MPAGSTEAEPGDLLAGERMSQLLSEAARTYDHVIVDSPPLLPHVADARILSRAADGTLLTVRGGSTPRDLVVRALAQLDRVLGVVVNGFDVRETPPYYRGAWRTGTVA